MDSHDLCQSCSTARLYKAPWRATQNSRNCLVFPFVAIANTSSPLLPYRVASHAATDSDPAPKQQRNSINPSRPNRPRSDRLTSASLARRGPPIYHTSSIVIGHERQSLRAAVRPSGIITTQERVDGSSSAVLWYTAVPESPPTIQVAQPCLPVKAPSVTPLLPRATTV